MEHRVPGGRYRGSRRAPAPPRGKYATAVTTAVLGAGVVALGTTHAMPERNSQPIPPQWQDGGSPSAASNGSVALREQQSSARANRSSNRVTEIAVTQQPGQDLWQLPVRGNYVVSSLFGPRWGVLHPGTDLAVPMGTPIYAANAGTVILCRWNGGYGYNVQIQHDDGVVSVYGHASKLMCKEGARVDAGQLIALSGNTGYSTGPHLHFELRRDNKPFDAIPFMRQHGVDLSKHIEVVNGGVLDSLG